MLNNTLKTGTDLEAKILPSENQIPKPQMNKLKWRDAVPQIIASVLINTIVTLAGINMAYSAILLPQLDDIESDIVIDKNQASWIASIVAIATPVGSLIAGPLMDRYGRKTTLLISCLTFTIGWALIASASNITMIYVARLICGCAGGLNIVTIIYISEITHPTLRPMLACLNSVVFTLGILTTSVLALFFNWRVIAVINTTIPVFSFVGALFVPESPYWTMKFLDDENKRLKAKSAINWLYKDKNLSNHQFEQLLANTDTQPKYEAEDRLNWSLYKEPRIYKPFLTLVGLLFVQQTTGAYAIIFYAINFFTSAGGKCGEKLDEYRALVLLGLIRFVMSIVTSGISKKYDRRHLMFASGLGSTLFALIACFIAFNNVQNTCLLIFCILAYVCLSSLGILVIPWILIGDLLPMDVKGKLGGLLISIAYVLMFGAVKIFPYAMDSIGIQGLFLIFAVSNIAGVFYVNSFIPNTLGKSFKEIENFFVPQNSADDNWSGVRQ